MYIFIYIFIYVHNRPVQIPDRVRFGSGQGRIVGRLARRPCPTVYSVRSGWLVLPDWTRRNGSSFLALGRVLGQISRLVASPWIIAGQKLWFVPVRRIGQVGSGCPWSGLVHKYNCYRVLSYDISTHTTLCPTNGSKSSIRPNKVLPIHRVNLHVSKL